MLGGTLLVAFIRPAFRHLNKAFRTEPDITIRGCPKARVTLRTVLAWRQDVGVAACVTRIIYGLKRNSVSKSLAKSAIKRQLKVSEQKQLAIKLKLLPWKQRNDRSLYPIEANL